MQLTKEQFIRDFKDTLHEEQLVKVPAATPSELFTTLAKLIRKYYTSTWLDRNHALSDNKQKIAYYFSIEFLPGRMLETNLLNLGILDLVKEGFADLDVD
ncbi:TPA: glucan phosphorylase, partial [Bacillus anthracis]|nr:glucan phosphorylase [Bacillus anthracis]